ncbi:hypothetical protein B0H66DRAFT_564567 [Apodospora peruviana]|uniref:Uncharacterized protein n=1 Tax=Apodospora peruviana TaxID=516989 RepID=A0AAE0HYD3_9PEZI|nr:hypothetical protein B0H66DRAFT_564567 [Apodospora peruviana]
MPGPPSQRHGMPLYGWRKRGAIFMLITTILVALHISQPLLPSSHSVVRCCCASFRLFSVLVLVIHASALGSLCKDSRPWMIEQE